MGAWGLAPCPAGVVGEKLLPEPEEGTGPAAFHTQSRGWQSSGWLTWPPFPFQGTEKKSPNIMPVQKVQHRFRNTGKREAP